MANVQRERIERGIEKITRTLKSGKLSVSYRLTWAGPTGRMETKVVRGTLKEARATLASARVAVGKGEFVSAAQGAVLFLDVASQWLEVKASDWGQRTRRSSEWIVESKLKDLHRVPMKGLTFDVVSRFRAGLSKALAPSSVKRIMGVLSQICDYARKRGFLVTNPCQDLDPIKARKPALKMPLTSEVERLVWHLSQPITGRVDKRGRRLPDKHANPRDALLVEVAAYSGLRAGELAGLQMRDINFHNGSITVERSVLEVPKVGLVLGPPKSEAAARTVNGIDGAIMAKLRAHCLGLSPRDFVFVERGKDGVSKPVNHGNRYKRVIKPAALALGIDMTFHGLRHHYASLLIDLGLSPVEVAAQLGHERAAITLDRYAHLFNSEVTDISALVAERRRQARGEGGDAVA